MRTGDIQGVIPVDSKVGGVPGGGMPGQGKNPGKVEGTFHVSTLEVESCHLVGGTVTVTVV